MGVQRIRLALGNVKNYVVCQLTEETGFDITTVTVDLVAFGGWDSPAGCDGDLSYMYAPTSVDQIDAQTKQISLFVDGVAVNPPEGTYTLWVHASDTSGVEDWVRADDDSVIITGGTPSPISPLPSVSDVVLGWAVAEAYSLLSVTRDVNDAIVTASIQWPDGVMGTFTTDVASLTFSGAIDSYHVTYGSPTIHTFTQPLITRDINGFILDQPALVVS